MAKTKKYFGGTSSANIDTIDTGKIKIYTIPW